MKTNGICQGAVRSVKRPRVTYEVRAVTAVYADFGWRLEPDISGISAINPPLAYKTPYVCAVGFFWVDPCLHYTENFGANRTPLCLRSLR